MRVRVSIHRLLGLLLLSLLLADPPPAVLPLSHLLLFVPLALRSLSSLSLYLLAISPPPPPFDDREELEDEEVKLIELLELG